jgi:hypothetical protein
VPRQRGQELLGLVEVRTVPGVLDDRFPVAAARGGVVVKQASCLRDHRLRRPGVRPRPAGHRPDRAEVAEIVQRGVRHDHVVRAPHPQHRRLGFNRGQAGDPEVGRRHRVQHPAVARREPRPGGHLRSSARIVIVADPGRQHRLDEDVQVRRHEGRLHVMCEQHLAGRRGAVRAPVAGRQAGHEVGVGGAPARSGAGRVAQRALRPEGTAEPEGGDRRLQRHGSGRVRRRPVGEVLQQHAAAHAPAHEVHGRQRQGLDEGGHVIGVVAQATGRVHRRGVGVAEAAQVHGQRPVLLRQREHGALPEERRGHVAVHEKHRLARTPGHRKHGHGQPLRGYPFHGNAR